MRAAYRLFAFVAAIAIAVAAWLPAPQQAALDNAEAGLKRALATYAVARVLNAAISVAQHTQLSVQPWGVGLVTAPGQALAPLNDLIDQFSTLMLAASVGFGVHILLIQIGAHWLLSLALTVAVLAWAAAAWRREGVPRWLARLVVVLVVVRFAAPLGALGSDWSYRVFMADRYATAQAEIDRASVLLRPAATPAPEAAVPNVEQPSVLDRAKGLLPKLPDVTKIPQQVKQAAEQAVRHVIDLIVVFVLQTLVVPLVILWMLLAAARGFGRGVPAPAPRREAG